MIVAGEQDKLKLPDFAVELAERVPGGRLIVYPNCGHAPNIEVAEEFNTDLLAFLAGVYPGRSARRKRSVDCEISTHLGLSNDDFAALTDRRFR